VSFQAPAAALSRSGWKFYVAKIPRCPLTLVFLFHDSDSGPGTGRLLTEQEKLAYATEMALHGQHEHEHGQGGGRKEKGDCVIC
jgi:hypothetical protein